MGQKPKGTRILEFWALKARISKIPFGFSKFFWKGTRILEHWALKAPNSRSLLVFGIFLKRDPDFGDFGLWKFQNPGPFSKKSQKPKGTWNSELSEPNVPKSGSLFKKIPKTKRDLEFGAFRAQCSKIRVPFQKNPKVCGTGSTGQHPQYCGSTGQQFCGTGSATNTVLLPILLKPKNKGRNWISPSPKVKA